MKKKARKTPWKSTLRESELVPITDPAVQAALDRLRRMAKPVVPAILRNYGKPKARKAK